MHKTWQTCSLFFMIFSASFLLYLLQTFKGVYIGWDFWRIGMEKAWQARPIVITNNSIRDLYQLTIIIIIIIIIIIQPLG